jgi:LmbE family N-acetylglucosaminyl deacetylase
MLGAHPDDIECGLGGTWFQHLNPNSHRRNDRAKYAVFSSTSECPTNRNIRQELRQSIRMLGLTNDDCLLFDHPWMQLQQHRGTIRQQIWGMKETLHPDLVFIPSIHDQHQDHQVVAQEAYRIFRCQQAILLGYEISRSIESFQPTLYVSLSPAAVEAKQNLLAIYRSQQEHEYMHQEAVEAVMRVHGLHASCKPHRFAEAFEVYKIVL